MFSHEYVAALSRKDAKWSSAASSARVLSDKNLQRLQHCGDKVKYRKRRGVEAASRSLQRCEDQQVPGGATERTAARIRAIISFCAT